MVPTTRRARHRSAGSATLADPRRWWPSSASAARLRRSPPSDDAAAARSPAGRRRAAPRSAHGGDRRVARRHEATTDGRGRGDDRAAAGRRPASSVEGLLTFRGSPTRTYYGEGPVPAAPQVLWSYPGASGGMCAESIGRQRDHVWCGSGWTGQPSVFEHDGPHLGGVRRLRPGDPLPRLRRPARTSARRSPPATSSRGR